MRRRTSDSHSRLGFRDGLLYVASDGLLVRVRAWPRLEVQTQNPDGTWQTRDVDFRDRLFECVGYLRPPASTTYVFARGCWWDLVDDQGYFAWSIEPPRERRRAWGQFGWERLDATLPAELSRSLRGIDVDWFSGLELVQNVPDALDLQRHDPLLFAALARHWEFPSVGRVDWTALRLQVRKKRREILEWLGYAPAEATVNALRRHQVVEVYANRIGEYVRQFLDVTQNPLYGPELLRRETTHSDLVSALANPTTKLWLDGEMLREILRVHRKAGFHAASEISAISALVACDLIKPSLAFLREHRRRGHQTADWVASEIADLPFPRWPLSVVEGVEPLTSVHQLVNEGREMRNCIGTVGYVTAALQGRVAVFRVKSPIRATLALRFCNGLWYFGGLSGVRNTEVTAEHRRVVCSAFPWGVHGGWAVEDEI